MDESSFRAVALLRDVREWRDRVRRGRIFAAGPHRSPTSVRPHTCKSLRSWARRRRASHRNLPGFPPRRGSACWRFLPRNRFLAQQFPRLPAFRVPPALWASPSHRGPSPSVLLRWLDRPVLSGPPGDQSSARASAGGAPRSWRTEFVGRAKNRSIPCDRRRRCLEGSLFHDLDEDIFQILFAGSVAQLGEGALGQQPAVVDDPDVIAELFDFAHDMRGENHRLAAIAAFPDETDDRARGHYVQAHGGLIENHHRGIVYQGARNGDF